MEIVKITSPKHPGDIFLRLKNIKGSFIGKIYAGKRANYYADLVIKALKDIEDESNSTPDS